MKRKLLLLLLLPLFAFGAWVASWQSVGNSLQRSNDNYKYRTDLGSGRGFVYWYQMNQVDSLFLNVPTQLITDSSSKPATTAWVYRYALANQVYFSPLYFYNSGSFSTPIKVGNSDSLGHQPPSYYLAYGNFTGVPTSLPPNGTAGGDLSGTYPNPTVAKFNGQLPSFYATLSQILVGRNAANFGQTASLSDVGHYANTGSDNTFEVGGWLNLLSVSSDSVKMTVAWTDGHGVSQTSIMTGYKVNASTGNVGTVRDYAFHSMTVRAEIGTTIQVSTTVSGAGSILYEAGCWINKIVGDGGL